MSLSALIPFVFQKQLALFMALKQAD